MACAVELEAYETPAFHDRLVRAAGGGQFRPWQVVEGLTGLAGALIGIAGITLALLALQPWLVPLVLAAAVPLLVAVARGGELMFRFHHRTTEAERRRNYLYMLLSGKDAAKELRAFGLEASCAGASTGCTTSTWPSCARWPGGGCACRWPATWPPPALGGIVAVLLVLALDGRIGLADAGTAAGAVFVLGERLMNAVFSAGMLYESSLFIEDFTSFVAMAPEVEARRRRDPAPSGFRRLRVEDVSFTYPSATTPALTGVSMEIGAGEIVALVGENGSGKTTLAKLLCRLYLPHGGRVLWDGVDTATVDPDELRRSVAVIFQDFLHYSLPASENIGMGRHQRIGDTEAIRGRRCTPAPTSSWPGCPPATRPCSGPSSRGARALGRPVAAGRAGQGVLPRRPVHHPRRADRGPRRPGRARAVREHPDPVPGPVGAADLAPVLQRALGRPHLRPGRGRVAESGSHGELMALGGRYAELFTLQASAYLSSSWPS